MKEISLKKPKRKDIKRLELFNDDLVYIGESLLVLGNIILVKY